MVVDSLFFILKSERNLNFLEETSDSLWLVNERKNLGRFSHTLILHSVVPKTLEFFKKKNLLILLDLLGTS